MSRKAEVPLKAKSPGTTTGATATQASFGKRWYPPSKAVIEWGVALVLLVVTAPLMLLCALVVRLTSRGPALYSQARVGYRGRPYQIYKLRTMYHDCERSGGPRWSTPGDPRVTPVGRFLRATHLDELPQLFNVLRGEMSLVGPRPERPEFVPALARALPGYRDRLLVRPGVTGLAQVQLPPDTNLQSVRRKLAYDLYYIQRLGPWLDMRILLGTGLKVFGVPFGLLRKAAFLPTEGAILTVFREHWLRQPRPYCPACSPPAKEPQDENRANPQPSDCMKDVAWTEPDAGPQLEMAGP